MIRRVLQNESLSTVGLLALMLGPVYSASAQEAATPPVSDEPLEEVTVTGSSLRGAPAVGSNLISLDAVAIEENAASSVQQILQSVPQVWGSNAAGQGAFASFDASGLAVPQIHGLGGANSSSTLVVIDGHRFPLMGVRRNLPDPNFIPPNAIQRVEVLPEGASSIYGSDAVAGVINFITKKRYEGFGVSAQKGSGDDYDTWSASMSLGHRWDDGGMAVFYTFSDRSGLLGGDRPETLATNQINRGGRNFGNFNCAPTTFQPAGSSQIFLYPYTTGMSNAQTGAPCEQSAVSDMIPAERRHSLMLKLDQQVGEKLLLTGDVVYSDREADQRVNVGTISATVFGPGSGRGGQINPFYVAPTGSTATSGTVRFAADELFPDAHAITGQEIFYAYGNAEYSLTDNWRLTGFVVAGQATSSENRYGELCSACLLLALNGSTNSNGVLTDPAIPGTTVVVNNVPLTTANAVDLWNPLATNRTSPEVMRRLTDSRTFQRVEQVMQQYNVKVDGSLFSIKPGDVRVALGVDWVKLSADSEVTEPNNTGPSSQSASYNAFLYEREVKSAFAEVLIPVISRDMDIPGVRSLEFNISGRYDKYDEFGDLTNPKYAFNWEIIEGLKIRGNYAESFVAPQFSTYGPDKLTGQFGRSIDAFFGPRGGTVEVPLDKYPEARTIPGCNTPGQTVCVMGTSQIPGMQIDGANPDVGPATGENWALGLDFTPTFLPGFVTSLTYWHTLLEDAAGSPPLSIVVNSDRFHDLLRIYPGGATPAQISEFRGDRRQRAPLAAGPIYFGIDFRNFNVYTVEVEGIDYDVHYRYPFSWGSLRAGINGTYKTKFDQSAGGNEPSFSILDRNRFIGTFPSIQSEWRVDVGTEIGNFKATAFANFTGGYTFWGTSAINPVLSVNGIPTSGGDHVDSYMTVSLNLQYKLQDILPGDVTVFVDVDNLLDEEPPFVNFASGYDNFLAFPLGRVITAGLRAQF
ncbi:MAG TPA: TonB-dependent receptor [Steroidobacteraceae bacterium]|nr:TonB-dependent receptor [Steroidobacteraceae bacterium]